VKTTTDPTAEERKRNRTVSVTTSRDLRARFDPKTSRMAAMEQTGDFTYDEGGRKARAAKAIMDSDQNTILLDTGARMWDATGSTSADRIRLDQHGRLHRRRPVNSSRLRTKTRRKIPKCWRATALAGPGARWIRATATTFTTKAAPPWRAPTASGGDDRRQPRNARPDGGWQRDHQSLGGA
jgi:hypothetical protein